MIEERIQRWRIISDQGEFVCLEYGPFLVGDYADIENLGNEETTQWTKE